MRALAKEYLTERLTEIGRDDLERLFDSGRTDLRLFLRDGMTYTLRYGIGRKMALQVPRSPYGTVLEARLDWRKTPEGRPELESVTVGFRSAAEANGLEVPLSRDQLPRILTPASLTSDTHDWRSVLTDTSADLAVERVAIARDGSVSLDGEVRLFGGLVRQPLHETSSSGESLEWSRALSKLALGLSRDKPDAWMKVLGTIVGSCRFDIELTGVAEHRVSARLNGEARVRELGSFDVDARLGLQVAKGAASVEVSMIHDAEREAGRARATVSTKNAGGLAERLDLGQVRWNEFGVRLDAIDIDAVAPVALCPPGPVGVSPRLGSPPFVQRLEERLQGALVLHPTTSTRFVPSGERLHQERLGLIRRAVAGDTLLLQTYIFRDDTSGRRIVDELVAAAARGAEVFVLLDAMGSLDADLSDGDLAPGAYRRLQEAGVPVRLVKNPLRALDEVRCMVADPSVSELGRGGELGELGARVLAEFGRDHRKRLMRYGERPEGWVAEILIGGNNVGDEYDRSPLGAERRGQPHGRGFLWLDGDLHVESLSMASQEARDFRRTWSESGEGEVKPRLPPDGASSRGAGPSGPGLALLNDRPPVDATSPEDGRSYFSNLLLTTFSSLGRGDRLYLETPYLVFLPELHQALEGAAKAGAKISIVTNGPHEPNDAVIVAEHTRWFHLRSLLDAGVEVFERQPGASPVHQKSFVALDRKGRSLYAIGTPNCDQLSARVNREAFVLGGTMLGRGPSSGETLDPVELGLLEAFRRHSKGEGARRLRREDVSFPELDTLLRLYGRAVFHPVF